MTSIRSKNTKAEMLLRKEMWARGIRGYRIHSNLIGKPDIYFPRFDIAIFIDGCFWHKCPKCYIRPKTSKDYWDSKISRNVSRAKEVNSSLNEKDIKVIRIWEHQVKKDLSKVISDIEKELNNAN